MKKTLAREGIEIDSRQIRLLNKPKEKSIVRERRIRAENYLEAKTGLDNSDRNGQLEALRNQEQDRLRKLTALVQQRKQRLEEIPRDAWLESEVATRLRERDEENSKCYATLAATGNCVFYDDRDLGRDERPQDGS